MHNLTIQIQNYKPVLSASYAIQAGKRSDLFYPGTCMGGEGDKLDGRKPWRLVCLTLDLSGLLFVPGIKYSKARLHVGLNNDVSIPTNCLTNCG